MTDEEKLAYFDQPPPPIIIEASEAYFRDQAELLAHRAAHPDERWVAYHGSQRVAIGTSQRELVKECLQRGIPWKQFLVIAIDASVKPVMDCTL